MIFDTNVCKECFIISIIINSIIIRVGGQRAYQAYLMYLLLAMCSMLSLSLPCTRV